MKSILSYLLLCIILLSLGCEGQSNPPFLPDSPDFTTTDWITLAKHYAPLLIVPIALGIILCLFLTLLNCVTCCCPKCCCAPPCCFDSKLVICGIYTVGLAIIVGACIAAWYHAPMFTKGTGRIIDSITGVLSDIKDFFLSSEDRIQSLADELAAALTPAFNSSSVNSTTNDVLKVIDDTRVIVNQINTTIASLENYYQNISAELTIIENETAALGINNPAPLPSEVPSPASSSIFNITQIYEMLDSLENDARSISSQVLSSVPPDITKNLPQGYSFFPNFTLPFNFSTLLDKLEFGFDKILALTGLTNPLSFLNQTISSFPITTSDLQNIGKVVDQNGGVYTIVVSLFGASIVIAYLIWYGGYCINLLHRAPFCWSAIIIIFMGFAIGIHLTLGTVTNDFCVQRDTLIVAAANKAYEAAQSRNFSAVVMKPLEKILKNPLLIIQCTGNETVFGLYNISLWDDLGFANTINELLNGTNLPSLFPSNSSTDQGVQALYDKQNQMETTVSDYRTQAQDWRNTMVSFQDQLIQESIFRGCVPLGPCLGDCCRIRTLNTSTQNVINSLDQVNSTLDDLTSQLNDFSTQLANLEQSRRTIVDNLANSLKFPDLTSGLGFDIVDSLGYCSWLGNFWSTIIGQAICSEITPALLWVGWSFALIGVVMIILTPIIVWSLNMDDGIV